MLTTSQYFPEWSSVWQSSPLLIRLFLLLLLLPCVYTGYFALSALAQLRFLRATPKDESLQKSLARLDRRSANLRQVITGILYLFGFVIFVQLQIAFSTPESNRPIGLIVLDNFREDFRIAAFVFLVFLVLHSVQWFVSTRIRKFEFPA